MDRIPHLPGVFAYDYDTEFYAGNPLTHWQYFPTAQLASYHACYHSHALTKALSKSRKRKGGDGVASLGGVNWITAERAYTSSWWDRSKDHLVRVFPFLVKAPAHDAPRRPARILRPVLTILTLPSV